MRSSVKFAHITTAFHERTVAYRINDEANTVEAAVGFCNPNDQFNKAIGRAVAQGRLESSKGHTFSLEKIGSTRYRDIISFLNKVDEFTAPAWALRDYGNE